MTRRQEARAWAAQHRAERDELLLARLHSCLVLGLVGVVAWSVELAFDGPLGRALRSEYLVAYALLCLAVLGLVHVAPRQHARALAMAYILALVVDMILLLQGLPEGAELSPAVLITILLGTTLFLPWGTGAAAAVGLSTLVGYASIHWSAAHPPSLMGAVVVFLGVSVSVVGTHVLDVYRARLFERSWHQAELVSLTRELVSEADPAQVIAKAVEHGRRLVGADAVILTERDPERHVYRVTAIGPEQGPVSWLLGVEFPEGFGILPDIMAAETVRVPEDAPASALAAFMREQHLGRLLAVAMRCSDDVVGVLLFVRRWAQPFEASERLLARGVADQAALALHNARLLADLRRANRLKSEFVSTMSHELRTPLNVILGFAEIGRDPALTAAQRDDAFERIGTAGTDLLGLIESTLEIGRMEAGRDEPQLEPVTIGSFWTALGQTCARMPRASTVRVDWREPAPSVVLVTDPRKLTVVMRNLMGNALKFTERGSVCAEALLEDQALVLRVSDTGIGIRGEDHETIFEMFRQADGSDTRRYGGTGLGLYIVRRFVQQLGGTVGVESAPGSGSVFTVRLPAAPADRGACRAA